MTRPNLPASVHARLLNLCKAAGADFNLLLTRYATERLLCRLCACGEGNRFVLKGAMLFACWTDEIIRPTRDLDLPGRGDLSEPALREVFARACAANVEPDGMRYDAVKVAQWRAFLGRGRLTAQPADFVEAAGAIRAFLLPPIIAIREQRPFESRWKPGGPWEH